MNYLYCLHTTFSSFGFSLFWLRDFLSFFPSCPSCLAKCKHRILNIFISKSDQKPKTKKGMNETLAVMLELQEISSLSFVHRLAHNFFEYFKQNPRT